MYASNAFSKRRPNGWVERRRRFDRMVEQARAQGGKPDKIHAAPVDKPKR